MEMVDRIRKELNEQGFKGFASLAQANRCDSLVKSGVIAKEVYDRDLLATDLGSLVWRKGPSKEGDPTDEEKGIFVMALSEVQFAVAEEYEKKKTEPGQSG